MSNPFDSISIAANSFGAANSAISSTVSDISSGSLFNYSPKIQNSSGTINQTEKLFTVRSRAANTDSGRGPTAYIKVITSQPQYAEYLSGSTKRELTYKNLVGSGGDFTLAADSSSPYSGYNKFLLTGVRGNFSEKVQITQVFGDGEVVYYFGRQPMMFSLSGLLVDSPDNDWLTSWFQMYSDVLRGTQLAKNYELVKIVLPNMVLTGSVMDFSWEQNSGRDTDIPFSFQFLAKVVEPIPAIATSMPTNNLVAGVNFSQASTFTGQSQINSLKGQIANLSATIQDPSSSLYQKSAALRQIGTGVGGTFGTFLQNGNSAISGFQHTVDGWTSASNLAFNNVSSSPMFQSVTSSLNGIRGNLFSPIYGVLTSLTKLVSNTLGQSTSIFNSIVIPVRNIIRDITNISNQAINLVDLVNSSISSFGRNVTGQIRGVGTDYQTAIQSLSMASGVIATAPTTSAQAIAHMFQAGSISVASPFLVNIVKTSYTRPSLVGSALPPSNKAALLRSIPVYTPATSNFL